MCKTHLDFFFFHSELTLISEYDMYSYTVIRYYSDFFILKCVSTKFPHHSRLSYIICPECGKLSSNIPRSSEQQCILKSYASPESPMNVDIKDNSQSYRLENVKAQRRQGLSTGQGKDDLCKQLFNFKDTICSRLARPCQKDFPFLTIY